MIDYLLLFPTPEDRAAAYSPEEGTAPCWSEDGVTYAHVTICVFPATYDEQGNPAQSAVFAPGTWLRVRADQRLPGIESLPNCLLATDTDRAAAGEPFVYFYRFQPDTLLGQITPMFSGDEYTIPAGQPASVLDSVLVPE